MLNKKGVSDIVTTVLIILLVLAAVSIIGKIILDNLQKGGDQIQQSTECFSLDVEPIACSYAGNGSYAVQYKWVKGSDANLVGVKIFLYNAKGLNNPSDADAPGFLGVSEAKVKAGNLNGSVSYATVSGVIKGANGDIVPCAEAPTKVNCK